MNKRSFLLAFVLSLVSVCSYAYEIQKVAVPEVRDVEKKLSYHQKFTIRTFLQEEVNNIVGFEVYNRTNLDAILGENDFQEKMSNTDEVRRIIEMTGASYILVSEAVLSGQGRLLVSAILLNAETGQMTVTVSETMEANDLGMKQGCTSLAKKLFNKISLSQRTSLQMINKMGSKYEYMGSIMDKDAYENFLQKNCPKAYKQLIKGKKLSNAGLASFVVGLVMLGGGVASLAVAEREYRDYYDWYNETEGWYTDWYGLHKDTEAEDGHKKYIIFHSLGIAGTAVGGSLTVVSIPLWISGSALKKKALKTFNEECAGFATSQLSLNLISGPNGLGIAMQF